MVYLYQLSIILNKIKIATILMLKWLIEKQSNLFKITYDFTCKKTKFSSEVEYRNIMYYRH